MHYRTIGAATLAIFLAALSLKAQLAPLNGRWHIGLEFGELPWHGSFKPGLAIGYHVNDYVYAGFVYQIADAIRRDGSSFNAQAIKLDGLTCSSERVGQRAYLQMRLRPHRLAPYASVGLAFNDRDTEIIRFDNRLREIGGERVTGAPRITLSRPAGLRPALGFGYSYTFPSGLALFTEWAGWWIVGAPEPDIDIAGALMSARAQSLLRTSITEDFTSSPFNTYHVFQIGVGYTW